MHCSEDNLVNQRVATRMLSNMGYSVDLATNGLEAVQAVTRSAYDLIFMDIQVRGGAGVREKGREGKGREGKVR